MYFGRQVVRYWPYSCKGELIDFEASAGLTPTGSVNGARDGSAGQSVTALYGDLTIEIWRLD